MHPPLRCRCTHHRHNQWNPRFSRLCVILDTSKPLSQRIHGGISHYDSHQGSAQGWVQSQSTRIIFFETSMALSPDQEQVVANRDGHHQVIAVSLLGVLSNKNRRICDREVFKNKALVTLTFILETYSN